MDVFNEWLVKDTIGQRYAMNPNTIDDEFNDAELSIILSIINAEREAEKSEMNKAKRTR